MFSIRQAGPAGIPLIRELTFKVWPQTYRSILSPEQIDYMLEMMYSEESLQKQMEEGCRFILGYDGEEPAGFASTQEIRPGVYKLHKLYVLPDRQQKGMGRFLISHIIREGEKTGARSLQLQVNRNNKARIFYERLGFTVIDEINLDIGNGFIMDDYIMEKKLSAAP